MDEANDSDENEHPWVVSVSLSIERIVTNFVTIWQIVNVGFFLPSVTSCIGREGVLMVPQW